MEELDIILNCIEEVTEVDLRKPFSRVQHYRDAKHLYGWMVKNRIKSIRYPNAFLANYVGWKSHVMIIYHNNKAKGYREVDRSFKALSDSINELFLEKMEKRKNILKNN